MTIPEEKVSSIDTLFICADFFGYAAETKRQLESRGRKVAWFNDRPRSDSLTKAAIRIAPWFIRGKAERYFDDVIAYCQGQPIRDVLVIKGEALSPEAILRLRAAFPTARFTLYFWDSYLNMPANSHQKVALFDRVLSFDPRDCERDPRLVYRPLFFLDRFAQIPDAVKDIDLLFFGTMHGDRFPILQRISRALPPSVRFEKFLYFPAKWLFLVHAFRFPAMLSADRRDFIFKPKSRAELMDLLARSRIVVDVERPVQCGYTMRSVEALGSGRKLITTNIEMANADFYHPDNILVIDRVAPRIPADFLNVPFRPVAAGILHRYSLSGWLDEVLP